MADQLEVWDGTAWTPVSTGVPGARVLAQVATTAPTPRGVGLMLNPDFVTGLSPWAPGDGLVVATVSNGILTMSPGSSSDPYVQQAQYTTAAPVGKTFSLRARVKGKGLIGVHQRSSGGVVLWGAYTYWNTGSTWTEVTAVSPAANAASCYPWVVLGPDAATCDVDWIDVVQTDSPRTAIGQGDMWINPNEYMFQWDTGWKYPVLLNGWVNFASDNSHAVVKYRRMAGEVVVISGLVNSGSGTIFTLPPGYRPTKRLIFQTTSGNLISRLDVAANGDVIPSAFSGWFNVECSFYASA